MLGNSKKNNKDKNVITNAKKKKLLNKFNK